MKSLIKRIFRIFLGILGTLGILSGIRFGWGGYLLIRNTGDFTAGATFLVFSSCVFVSGVFFFRQAFKGSKEKRADF